MPGLLLESGRLLESLLFTLECSQSIFENQNIVCFITSVPCLAIV